MVAAVLLAALALSGTATYLAFAAYLRERLDAALRDTPIVFAGTPDNGDGGPGPRVTPYVRILGPDGSVLLTQAGRDDGGRSYTADLPAVLPAVARSDTVGGPAVFFNTRSRDPAGIPLRVKVSTNTHGQTLVLALPLTDNNTLLRRLALVEVCVAAAALVLASAAATLMVRRRLRPLRRLAGAVDSLRPEDLATRVPVDRSTREVHDLAVATNMLLQRMDDAFATEQATQDRLRRFVADASHELRTPVAAISAYAQLFDLGARHRPEDLARSMSGIQRETSRMRDLTEDLLTLAGADASGIRDTQPVDLRVVVAAAVEAALDVDARWPITVALAPDAGPVTAEPAALRRVLDNLIANVRAHTPAGTRTRIEARRDGADTVLTVADDGPGLSADERSHVFDRFWRKDPSRSRHAGGSGLGLSIVATLVAGWHGRVTASPSPEGGLAVTLVLPTARPAAGPGG
ncbi:MAG TPA: HAMP domain-containing sensor histidine kinase [Rugosimonospora sp.]|nr:HAMP domain-containing sensor histidine kinase [Rugosimonospora sp.]